jgi:Domain of unknown function (DUF1707)/Cell wall-active antibiotics response 4TMS YvqF
MSDERTPILASDAERERNVELLREAVAEGRLTLEEFTERVGVAQTARTDVELADLVRDLPAAPAVPTAPAVSLPAAPIADEHKALFSHVTRSGPLALPARSSWRSIFGTIDLDLRQARLADNDTLVEVYNFFGTVTLVVPEGVEVVVRGGGLFASQHIDPPVHPPVAGAPRLTIDTRGPGGTLHVRTQLTLKQTLKETLRRALG